jgi:hypothetical protein
MARPVSTHTTAKFRLSKTVVADLEEMHWVLRKDSSEIVEAAVIEYLAKNAPKSGK